MIQNEHILIRAIEPEDLEYLYQWENNMELWEISETLTPFSLFTLKKYIDNAHRDIYETKQLRLIIAAKDSLEPIGSVELYNFDPFHLKAGIGIMIHDSLNRKKGYAKNAIDLILYYAFETLGLNQVYCYIPEYNIASLNLFQGSGFQRTGTMKQWLKRGNKWEDVAFLQILANDRKKQS